MHITYTYAKGCIGTYTQNNNTMYKMRVYKSKRYFISVHGGYTGSEFNRW